MGGSRPGRVACVMVGRSGARLWKPDKGSYSLHGFGEAGQLVRAMSKEVALEIEILGGIAGEAEFAEGHEVGAFVAGTSDARSDERGVLGHRSDGRVYLCERDL